MYLVDGFNLPYKLCKRELLYINQWPVFFLYWLVSSQQKHRNVASINQPVTNSQMLAIKCSTVCYNNAKIEFTYIFFHYKIAQGDLSEKCDPNSKWKNMFSNSPRITQPQCLFCTLFYLHSYYSCQEQHIFSFYKAFPKSLRFGAVYCRQQNWP